MAAPLKRTGGVKGVNRLARKERLVHIFPAAVLAMAIVFVAFVFVWWLNEVLTLRKLREARGNVAEALEAATK